MTNDTMPPEMNICHTGKVFSVRRACGVSLAVAAGIMAPSSQNMSNHPVLLKFLNIQYKPMRRNGNSIRGFSILSLILAIIGIVGVVFVSKRLIKPSKTEDEF